MDLGPVDYTSTTPPAGYRCTKCGAHGVKLWREYQTCADYTDLYCAPCALKDQGESGPVGEDGKHDTDLGRCDSIGWRVPAVPTAEGDTYWGYTSVPDEGCVWWRSLPTSLEVDPGPPEPPALKDVVQVEKGAEDHG